MSDPEIQARDARGWRAKFAVLGPSTNTIVQPDFDDLRPWGVTNHYSRIVVQDIPVNSDESFIALTTAISGALDKAIDDVITCSPDYMVMGMSAIAFYGGRAGGERFAREVSERAGGRGVSTGALATAAALEAYRAKRIAFLSPYFPVANDAVRAFFEDSGFSVVRDACLRCHSPRAIADVSVERLRGVIRDLDGDDVDAIVQVGTNLSMVKFAAAAEAFLGKPVIAINTATYWHALRQCGFKDIIPGYGALLEQH